MKRLLLVGNPNAGKTTIFNLLTKSDEHIGNWHGVTVREKEKKIKYLNEDFSCVDLPGIYSLSALSSEEKVSIDYVLKNRNDIVVNVCDYNNLLKNLNLLYELKSLNLNIILLINKYEKKCQFELNIEKLKELLNIEIIVIERKNKDAKNNFFKILKNYKPTMTQEKKCENNKIVDIIKSNCISQKIPIKFAYEKCCRWDVSVFNMLKLNEEQIEKIKEITGRDGYQINAKKINDEINNVFKLCTQKSSAKTKQLSILDKILLNKFLAFPIFFLILFSIFYFTFFGIGEIISEGLRDAVYSLNNPIEGFLINANAPIWFCNMISVAILGGVGNLLSFLPQIVMLFLFLGILEESGYFSRIAFLFDDLLEKFGLSGKCVYTLLMGLGCSSTACLTSRNMDDKNSQIKIAMATPFMSCSAKLPIYAVLGGAFFGGKNIFLIIFLYFLGAAVAVGLTSFYEKTFLKSHKQNFILEFSSLRFPSIKKLIKLIWTNSKTFLIRIGSLMISMNIIIWVLQSFSFSFSFVPVSGQKSILKVLGSFFAPIFAPLGFGSWGMVAALIAGLIAKEIIVTSIAIFNGVGLSTTSGLNGLQNSLLLSSSPVHFNPATCFSFLVFSLLYAPCLATTVVLIKEIGRKWTFIAICVQFALAYIITFILYTLYRLFDVFGAKLIFPLILILLFVASIIFIIKKLKSGKCPYSCANCNKNCKH
ncbi:MAG: ferrous iron transport protein B [Clostridia bacterium]